MRLPPAEYIGAVNAETDKLIAVARTVAMTDPVPSAPGWSVADLVWHLTRVQRFWATIVSERLMTPEGYPEPTRPDDDGSLIDGLDAAKTFLVATLSEADPDLACYTWSDEHNAGFVMRRQAHEALIHRADAELAAGIDPVVASRLAVDGIDEILTVMIGAVPSWATFTDSGRVIDIDAGQQRWALLMGKMTGTSPNSGTDYDIDVAVVVDEVPHPDAVISGTPGKLDLWLWGRAPGETIDIAGDPALADLLRSIAVEATQ
ncbi:MAG: maleylpyruvate isomerase family mycothiol-dependent enzyme [Actinomycetota bacterium]|nr:maleylpyruvate isomerase family mycothiol-dependent enzyme [Actinomycetota bacterium]